MKLLKELPKVISAFAATVLAMYALVGLATASTNVLRDQRRLDRQLAALEQEHRALQAWVAQELRPWARDVTEAVDTAPPEAPGESPAPSASPLLPLAPLPSPSPTAAPTPSPSPSLIPSASLEPSPSVCLPLICEGG